MPFRLWERIRDWILLFVLLIVAVVVMLTQNDPMLLALRASALQSTAWIEARLAWVGGYFRALDENNLLREENVALSSEVARSREAQLENERLRRLLAFRDTTSLPFVPARIVAKDIYPPAKYLLTINAGRADSIAVGMPVVDDRGVIGKVVLVSEHYARVMPYMNTDFRVSAKVLPIQAEGIVTWDGGRDRLVLEFVPRTEPVLLGQSVVTSGYSTTFPQGYSIGFVDSLANRPGRNELLVFLTPSSPIDKAEYVFVIQQQQDPEQLALEAQSIR